MNRKPKDVGFRFFGLIARSIETYETDVGECLPGEAAISFVLGVVDHEPADLISAFLSFRIPVYGLGITNSSSFPIVTLGQVTVGGGESSARIAMSTGSGKDAD
jgi:hypothetical protein